MDVLCAAVSDWAISHQLRGGDASGLIIPLESAAMSEVAEGRNAAAAFKKRRENVCDSRIGFIYESINSNRCALIWYRKHTSRSPIRSF